MPELPPDDSLQQLVFRLSRQQLLKRRQQRLTQAATLCPQTAPRETKLSPSQQQGLAYEEAALEFLQQRGLHLLCRNLKSPFGEIDLVMRDQSILVWVEVRARQHARYGGAGASINAAKQQRLRQTAALWLDFCTHHYFADQLPACRFDVVLFEGQEPPQWIKSAFV